MGEKIVVGPINKGLRTDRTAFVIDNDSFPTLINAYQWRGRVKRKRGTEAVNRLQRFFNSAVASYFPMSTATITGATQANPCVLTANNTFVVGETITISDVAGMTQLNGNTYSISVCTSTHITIVVDSTGFGAYVSGGIASLASEVITLDASGNGNILAGFNLQANGQIIPGTVTITDVSTSTLYTDPAKDGTLSPSGTIDYVTGEITILAAANHPVTVKYSYYPALPVMGLKDLNLTATQFPGNIAFDTTNAYNVLGSQPYTIYNVSFYKNPATNTYLGYTQKTNPTAVAWNGQNYQQFWSTNYEGAFWATNGIAIPFVTANIGMQFKTIVTSTTISAGPPGKVSLNITAHGLVIGDFVFLNEIANISGINFQTGYVISVTDANNVVVELPDATLGSVTTATITGATQANPGVLTAANTFSIGQSINITGVAGMTQLNGNTYIVSAGSTGSHITLNVDTTGFGAYVSGGVATLATGVGGIAQYLTSSASPTKDCMRWYDGDPTNGNISSPTLNGTNGWVNFCPPISNSNFSIENLPDAQYYLVSARVVLQFKDRLLFFGPIVQTSSAGPYYLQDTIIYSQNGSPYYTASFTGSVTSAATIYNPILTPNNQSAQANAYFSDVQGYGGFITAGYEAPILTVAPNQDVLIVGFATRKTKLVYSGNDIVPFNFFIINSEFGDASTFSTIVLDRGVYAVGNRGITITNQVECARFDEEIPDQVFEIDLFNNGSQRTSATRDYINEWVYFTYTSNSNTNDNTQVSIFPNQTLFYNYRDSSWAIFNECYTTYGQFRRQTGQTWATIGTEFPTWSAWNQPWNAGETTLLQQQVIAGNQQGFVVIKGIGTEESPSLYIDDVSFAATITGATAANPCVLTANNNFAVGESVTIIGVVGMTQLNGNTYVVTAATPTTVNLNVNSSAFTAYVSGGVATPLNPIYSPNHGLQNNDYIIITGCLGTVGTQLNGNVFSVFGVTQNSFNVYNPTITLTTGTYFGSGVVTRMYVPLIQTKQFPTSWGMSRKTRLGPQAYLFSTTNSGQIELQIYLSQDAANAYNAGTIVPDQNSQNNALIYTNVIATSPTYEILNCKNLSLGTIGNGAITSFSFNYQSLFGFQGSIVPGSVTIAVGSVATFTDNGKGAFTVTGTGQVSGSTIVYANGLITIAFSSAPTSQATTTTFQYQQNNLMTPTASTQSQLWQRMNTSLIGDTVQIGFTLNDAQMRDPNQILQFAEIELHSLILDTNPSQLLV